MRGTTAPMTRHRPPRSSIMPAALRPSIVQLRTRHVAIARSMNQPSCLKQKRSRTLPAYWGPVASTWAVCRSRSGSGSCGFGLRAQKAPKRRVQKLSDRLDPGISAVIGRIWLITAMSRGGDLDCLTFFPSE